MPPRQKRKKLKAEDAKTIYDTYTQSGQQPAFVVGRALGYKHSTIYDVIRKQGATAEHWRHPLRTKKWSADQITHASAVLENNAVLTLEELRDQMVATGAVPVHITTLADYLSQEVFTRKRVTDRMQERNLPDTKTQRKAYAQWFLNHQQHTFIYVDEFGYSLATQRHYGRSRAGQPAIMVTPSNRGTNISVAAAIQKGVGVIEHEDHEGSINEPMFTAFLGRVIQRLVRDQVPNPCIVMDNCRIHCEQILTPLCNQHGITLKFLPPYSPMLNPIEEVFGDIKRLIRTELTTTHRAEILRIHTLAWGLKSAARRQVLQQALATAVAGETIAQLDAHYAHSMSFLAPSLAGEDIP
jgi:transposase